MCETRIRIGRAPWSAASECDLSTSYSEGTVNQVRWGMAGASTSSTEGGLSTRMAQLVGQSEQVAEEVEQTFRMTTKKWEDSEQNSCMGGLEGAAVR